MKNAPLHSYPWYVADWRGSETRLTLPSEAKYVYRELLDQCWIEGSFPNDEIAMARIAAVELKEFRAVWPLLKDKFVESEGRLTHWRVLEKRGKLQSWANSRVKAGENGGNSKAERLAIATGKARGKAIATPLGNALARVPALPLPSVPSEPSETPPPPSAKRPPDFPPFDGPDPAQLVSDAVEECAQFWPNVGDKPDAVAAWQREAAEDPRGVAEWCKSIVATARQHAPAQKAAKAADTHHFIPHLKRWVTRRDYTSPPPQVIRQQRGPIDIGDLDG